MSLIIPVSSVTWITREVDVVFAVGSEIVSSGTDLIFPPDWRAIRNVMVSANSSDPLVGAGGATALTIGLISGAAHADKSYYVGSQTIGTWNVGYQWTAPFGSANYQNSVPYGPANAPGALDNRIQAFSDSGTITGTLHVIYEERKMIARP